MTKQTQFKAMKLWEAVSAFHTCGSVLQDVFSSERWRESFSVSFSRFGELVHTQDRNMLDSYLPIELTREIAARCPQLQFSLSKDGQLRRSMPEDELSGDVTMLSAVDVHDQFGGSLIEEVLEYGSAKIPKESA